MLSMNNFYENLAPEDVAGLDHLAKLLIELRESRMTLLARYAVASEEDLFERLHAGKLPEHTAYEDYLGARIITSTRAAIRSQLRDYMLQINPAGVSMNVHAQLSDAVITRYGERLECTPQQSFDALMLRFDTGLGVELRFASADEYSIYWQWQDTEWRIDTAPLHTHLSSFPNHVHAADGGVRPDLLTAPGRPPWENLRVVLDAILENPRLDIPPI